MKALLAIGLLTTVAAATPADDGSAYRALLDTVEVRVGVRHGSLVLLPLVLKEGVEPDPAPRFARTGLTVSPDGDLSTTHTVTLTVPDGAPRLIPAGLLVLAGERERMLSRPVLVAPGRPATVIARIVDAGETPVEAAPLRAGPLAPAAYRKTDLLLEDRATLALLQQVHAVLAGLPDDRRRVRDVLEAPTLAARVRTAIAALTPVSRASGEAAAGHVALLGHRPVEVVLAATPETYRSLAPDLLRGLAVEAVLWEEFQGRSADPPPDTDPRAVLAAAREAFRGLASRGVRLRRRPLGRREKGGGRTLHLVGPKPASDAPDRSRAAGRLLLDPAGRALLLEAYPSGAESVLPSPLTAPGGRPIDGKPDIRSGTLTQAFLARLAARRAARR